MIRPLKIVLRIVCWASLLATSGLSIAQQGCVQDAFGQVTCAGAGGGAARNAYGQAVTGRGGCATDAFGQVNCSNSQYGGAANDAYGQTRTGKGQCVQDALGQVMCSSVAGGGAAVNAMGQAVCTGGCVSGR